MNIIIIHKNKNSTTNGKNNLLRFAISSEPIAGVVLDGLRRSLSLNHNGKTVFAIPEEWITNIQTRASGIISYSKNIPIHPEILCKIKRNSWLIVSNGRFATQINSKLINEILTCIKADIIAVNAEPELLAYREKMRLNTQGKVAGFRRLYSDCAEPHPLPTDWPHHLFVKTNVLNQVLDEHSLPQSFTDFVKKCQSNTLTLWAINIAGIAIDLETEEGLQNFCRMRLAQIRNLSPKNDLPRFVFGEKQNSNTISKDAKLVGKVILGKNIRIDPESMVIGPAIIGDNVKIGTGAIIKSSIIVSNVRVPENQLVQNRFVIEAQCKWKHLNNHKNNSPKQICYSEPNFNHQQDNNSAFQSWPMFSYARCFKRIADIIAAIIVLILFAPIIPFIAIAIKLSSPGPVFFKDKRQARYGKEFLCMKFRTMKVGADKIQDKLRSVSQVDGPQFKMNNDPRISVVGRFLRDTYIDEIPQFFNVLLGQMSVIGPRPSPESENTLCPSWRDARLSVQPGITGLWQICRTRQPMKDFQEWIYYDTKYVRNLSLRMDLWICWHTITKLVRNFVKQF